VNLYADTSTFGNRQPDPITYASQRTRTVEAGLNWRSPARDLEAQAAVFQTQVRGYQETILTGGVGTAYLANIPEVQIPGGELSLRWRASPAWVLNTALGVARARYERYGFAGNLLAGRELANRPDWTATFGARWQQGPWRLGADVNGSASFLSAYQSDGSSTRVEGHWVLNLQGAYQLGDWTFTAAVNNANNQRYLLNSHYVVAGRQVPVGMAGSPRTVSLQAKVAL
jgi:outer membrane receptor protein involved in Fe transport